MVTVAPWFSVPLTLTGSGVASEACMPAANPSRIAPTPKRLRLIPPRKKCMSIFNPRISHSSLGRHLNFIGREYKGPRV